MATGLSDRVWSVRERPQNALHASSHFTGSFMRIYSSKGFWAIARVWYTCFGLIVLAMLVNAWQHGFDELLDLLSRVRPVGWLVIAAAFAPGPLAHWLAIRVKR